MTFHLRDPETIGTSLGNSVSQQFPQMPVGNELPRLVWVNGEPQKHFASAVNNSDVVHASVHRVRSLSSSKHGSKFGSGTGGIRPRNGRIGFSSPSAVDFASHDAFLGSCKGLGSAWVEDA